MAARDLSRLERFKTGYGDGASNAKLELLRRLDRASLRSARQVLRLHEVLCFLRAYPDDRRVLAQVGRMLERFHERPDLVRHRRQLADTGIVGTAIRYRFFWSTALWLATRWPDLLSLEHDDEEANAALDKALPLVLPPVVAEWFNAGSLPALPAMDRLRGRRTDAAYLVGHLAGMPGNGLTREAFADAIDAPFVLKPGRDTPSRTRALLPFAPRAFQAGPLRRTRPDLRAAAATRPRAVRVLSSRDGARLIELARCAMVTRSRDLMAFEYGNPGDVRLVDDGDGLAFGFCGVIPERRFTLPALYGYLTVRNGVPTGYGQVEVIGPFAAISFNVFETFRGAEAAHVFGRLVSATHHVFGATSFSVDPYQLGHENEDGIDSGAWWFYYKLGFRPRATAALRIMRRETARMRVRLSHRSSTRALRALAEHHVFFDLDRSAPRGLAPLQQALERGVDWLAARGGGADAVAAAERRALEVTGLKSLSGFTRDERAAWRRWAPLIVSIPGISRWSAGERQQLADIARAKGGRREIDFLVRYAAHSRLAGVQLGV
ncbi:MAG: hypothetical protein AMJ58_03145 [Gammaproteobacteria bacterium SG8_30]|nr:MAG: hypothetical protein AMJ58_03145 [Gammaproteobacteria bacterium SG8_30]